MSRDDAMRQMFREGQRRWPLVKLGFDVFAGHCTRVLGGFEDDAQLPTEPADLYLCCACAEAQPEALRAFENEGLGVAKAAIARINHESDFVQDTLQEVWGKLLLGAEARVRQYAGRGPLKAWVRVAATRVALDRHRARGRLAGRQVELSEQLAMQGLSSEALITKARFGPAFAQALRDAVLALSAQDRNVLRMHVSGHCSIDEIGRAYGVHRATAARWLDRARAQLHDSVRQELCIRQDKLTASELKSLAALMGAELELSFSNIESKPSRAEGQLT